MGGLGRKILRHIILPRVDKNPEHFQRALTLLLSEMAEQINGLAEERAEAHYMADSAVTAKGSMGLADFQRNNKPSVVTTTLPATTSWVLQGWTNTSEGTPGTMTPGYLLTSLT